MNLILESGSWMNVASPKTQVDDLLFVREGSVEVLISEEGILEASGAFIIVIQKPDGSRFRIPKLYPSISRSFFPDSFDSLRFSKTLQDFPENERCVIYSGGIFRIKGNTGIEAILPPKSSNEPIQLISVSGEVPGSILSSDLKTYARMESSRFDFWRSQYGFLAREAKLLRSMKISNDRVGGSTYRSVIQKALEGIQKLEKGYQMLQQNQFTGEVIRRMNEAGVTMPRLTLAEFSIIRGPYAVSLRPFINWRNEGRILADVAVLKTDQPFPTHYLPASYVFQDDTRKILQDTRITLSGEEPILEVKRPSSEEWRTPTGIPYDLYSVVALTRQEGVYGIGHVTDPNGFLKRRGLPSRGPVTLAQIGVTRDLATFTFSPESEDGNVTNQIANFLGVKRLLYYPDRYQRFGQLRQTGISDESLRFMDSALDELVAAAGTKGIDVISRLDLTFRKQGERTRIFEGSIKDTQGRSASVVYQADLSGPSVIETLYEGLERSRYATDWLDIDIGLERF